ncbi:Neuron navigator 3, partial [Dissostichus eleginoides]
IENVDACLNFLDAKGVNVTGLSAEDIKEEIRNGNLKSILGLFFILSRYKQQQQQQQQYFQSLVELSQQSSSSSASSSRTADMQSRLPGPSRVPAAGSGASRSSGSSNLNRRSQSFNSIDKSKPLQYASGNDREVLRGIPLPGGMNGSCSGGGSVPSSLSGQQLISSSIPSPTKSWRSKSMNLKHSATSSMLSSPTLSPSEAPEALHDGSKVGGGGHHQRSMLEKFRLINPRSASRASPSVAEMSLEEEDDLSEYANNSGRTGASSKDREDKSSSRSGQKSSKDSSSPKEESSPTDGNKKNSKIASLIPKGGKPSKKDGGNSSSGIPKTFSENDCTMMAPAEPCLSPTKGELVYSKTAKQCLEEISGTTAQQCMWTDKRARGRERRGSRSSTPLLTVVEENKAKKTESRKHEDAKEWEKKVTDMPP